MNLLVAAAGYGKSSWIDATLPRSAKAEHADRTSADELLALVADPPPFIALEGLHLAPAADRIDLLRAVATLSQSASVTVTTQATLTPKERAALRGPVLDRGPADLALSPAEVATVLAAEYGLDDPDLPSLVHHATAGWPMPVHLFADALRRHPELGAGHLPRYPTGFATAVSTADAVLGSWWESSVLVDLPEDLVDLLLALAELDVLTPALVAHIWEADEGSWVVGAYDDLGRMGLVRPHPRWAILGRPGDRVVPALAAHLTGSARPPDGARLRRAATWYQSHDRPMAALRCLLRVGDTGGAASVLDASGEKMIAHGDAADLVPLLDPASTAGFDLTPGRRLLLSQALLLTGRSEEARMTLRPLVRAADADGWDVRLAVSVGALSYSRGDLPGLRAMLDRVPLEQVPAAGEGARWRMLSVIADSQAGEGEAALRLAEASLDLAEESGAPADLSLAHQAMAKVSAGHGKAAHLDRAATYARAAGDAMSMAPILCNQSFALLAAADYPAAAIVSRDAVRTAELVRPVGVLVAALHNLAEASRRIGELDEARWHLRRAASVAQALGGGRVATSMSGLGDLHRALGHDEQAREAYQQAVLLARESDERQVLVPALAGLARVIVRSDVEAARALAVEAVELATSGLEAYALVALARVELAAGNADRALTLGTEAAAAAREDHALDLLADALEVRGGAEGDPSRTRGSLLEARAIWREAGAEADACRVEVQLARLDDADRDTVERGRSAAARLQGMGFARIGDRPAGEDPVAKDVRVLVLGGFEVLVDGQPVGVRAWRSRQARTLVKLLAARCGRPVSRGLLCEELWPDDDPVKTSHRLSVLLTTVRSVLDPRKAGSADRYLASDNHGVWLDLRRVSIDADQLVRDAEHAATLLASGHDREAGALLAVVDARFTGEAFEDEPYEQWAAELREEARAAWLRSLRHLATLATRQGRHNDAAAILGRLLRTDPYDEMVHRGLVRTLLRTGRHGEARRAFQRWAEAMAVVDAPAPDPRVLAAAQVRPGESRSDPALTRAGDAAARHHHHPL